MNPAHALAARAEAANDRTSSKRLALLAKEHSHDRELLAAIARNAQTALRTLLEIAPAVPGDVLASPTFVLTAMGGAAAFAKFPSQAVIALLAHGAPPEMRKWVDGLRAPAGSAASVSVQAYRDAIALASGARLSLSWQAQEQLAKALSHAPPIDRDRLLALQWSFHVHYLHTQADDLTRALEQVSARDLALYRSVLEGVARHPNAPKTLLLEIVRRCLRVRTGDGVPLFAELAECAALSELLLRHPAIDDATVLDFTALPADEDEGRDGVVRGALRAAFDRGLIGAEQRAALFGRELTARLALAAFPGLTPDELTRLAGDADHRVRRIVAARAGCGEAILVELARDAVAVVAEAALRSAGATPAVRRAGLGHPRSFVRRVAAELLAPDELAELEDTLAAEQDGLTRLAVATRRDVPAAVLARLARDTSPTVRRAIAKNPDTPVAVLDLLASDASPRVLDGLQKRPRPRAP